MADMVSGNVVDKAIKAALRGLSTRQRVISNNLANVDTPGYKAASVRFEDQLRLALLTDQRNQARLQGNNSGHLEDVPSSLDLMQPSIVSDDAASLRADGNSVDIEKEMVQLAETAISYNALVHIATSRLGLARYLANDGRR